MRRIAENEGRRPRGGRDAPGSRTPDGALTREMCSVEYESTLVALDVGTSKVVALVGEVRTDGSISVIGHGTELTTGLKKGQVINIDATVSAIRSAVALAETKSGFRIDAAFVGVGGAHLRSMNSRGTVAVSGQHREVAQEDVERATEVARTVNLPKDQELLHVIPRDFLVDGQEGVKDPIGMSAVRLEVEAHLVHGLVTPIQNLQKCVRQAGVRVDELIANALASGEAVLTDTERELGVAVADIGAGTTDLALYVDGSPFHTAALPLGGSHVTSDVAIGLKTTIAIAESLKVLAGSADPRSVDPAEPIPLGLADQLDGRLPLRADLADIIEARMREIFEKLGEEMAAGSRGHPLPAGLILTGGGASLPGVADLGREVLGMPVRVAYPVDPGGLTDEIITPAYSSAIGLLLWAARVVGQSEVRRFEPAADGTLADRVRTILRGLFP